jgi:5-methylcytosine-specific restriction enzyme A
MANAPKKVTRPWVKQSAPFERERTVKDFDYNARAWRNKAKAHKAAHPFCAECERQGIVTAVAHTDHIKPIKIGGDPWDDDNLQSLCKRCHDVKSAKERHV